MPPRGHSSSSHSSRSHSSHRSSGSRSHSSYHGHSSSSHSSVINYGSGSMPVGRTRVNQPRGYFNSSGLNTYRCRKHDYVFYPNDWIDSETGTSYQKGYYDENGNRYETLILKHNQKYENVPLKCEFCGTTSVRDLTDDTETMTCDNCGANMIIDAILDDAADTGSNYNTANIGKNGRMGVMAAMGIIFVICAIPVLALGVMFKVANMLKSDYSTQSSSQKESRTISNVDIFGSTLYLKEGDDGYKLADSEDYDKVLYWDYSYESYYDKGSDCYVWYNTDMSPNLWQYWYEDISSDYGDYGWMEYEDGEWYIERGNEDWILLDTDKYDTSELWHFDSASDVGRK